MSKKNREVFTHKLSCGVDVVLQRLSKDILPELEKFQQQQFMAVCDHIEDWVKYQNRDEYKEMRAAMLAYCETIRCTTTEGRANLFQNVASIANFVYRMIQNPPWAFEVFMGIICTDPWSSQKTVSEEGFALLFEIVSVVYHDIVEERSINKSKRPTQERLVVVLSYVLDELTRTDEEEHKFDIAQKAYRRFVKNCLGRDAPYEFPE